MTAFVTLENLKILLAEDKLINQRATSRYLEMFGHQVDCATDGDEAIKKFQKSNYDLILMDVEMPKMNGYQTTRAIRVIENMEKLTETPIILLTGHPVHDTPATIREKGLNGCIVKPVDMDLVLHILKHIPQY